MCDSGVILRLYSCVLHDHKVKYKVTEADIRTAIQNMKEVYKPNPGSLADTTVYVADYNDAGHRCAYLHKYAPFHTALVADMLQRALQQNPKLFKDLIYPVGHLNICSLGGGPGSDIFGVLSVLNATFGLFQVSATVIDCMENWRDTFDELISELRYGNYGDLGECVGEQYFDWKYLQHNLLLKMTNQVNMAIGRANLVTMIKFVSASSCKDTAAMIRKIFSSMKHGALVLYIDNAGGGFHKLVTKEAESCNFKSIFHQNHQNFIKSDLNVKKFGCRPMPCIESKVSIHIWRKKFPEKLNCSLPSYLNSKRNEPPVSSAIAILPPRKCEKRFQNETLKFDKTVSASSTSDGTPSRFIDTDNNDLFQEKIYAQCSTNTIFDSVEMNVKAIENFLEKPYEPQRKASLRKIPAEESVQYDITRSTINSNVNANFRDVVYKQSPTTPKTRPTNVDNVQNDEKLNYAEGGSSELQTEACPREILAKESIKYVIAENTICADFVSKQLHAQGELSETRTSTNQAVQESFSNRNTFVRFSWRDRIRDLFYQELIGLLVGELINLFQEDPMNSSVTTLGDRFQLYLFEHF